MDKWKKTIAAVILSSIAATLLLAPLVYFRLPVQGQTPSFIFSAAGDYATNAESWPVIRDHGGVFHLSLGDFSYGGPDGWCGSFKSAIGSVQGPILVQGNHDEGDMGTYTSQCPFPFTGLVGSYGFEYYFDYPTTSPLIRIVMTCQGTSPCSHSDAFVQNAIRNAKSAGIPWTAVGMHKVCIEPTGDKSCEIGQGFMDLLFAEK